MTRTSRRHVANVPSKPLMIFDGECHFCRRWIERWRVATAGKVDYAPSQDVAAQFPEITPAEFDGAVQLIDADGALFSGAAAVFHSLGYASGGKWLSWCYDHSPAFSRLTEIAYAAIAKRRGFASAATRLLWGNDVRQPTYATTRSIFVRALGAIYLIAFLSLWIQVQGLIGSDGVSPVREFLPLVREQLGDAAVWKLPTLCWLNASDSFLQGLCAGGAIVSVLLIAGLCPAVCQVLLFVGYLSLTIAGQTFLSFQWDILLLEAGFLAIFFAPWTWRLRSAAPVSRLGLFLLKLLLFKLMFMSGVVKLTSGDNSWWDLTALHYHYETQPLPTVIGWWLHHEPEWLGKLSTAFVFVVELISPFLIWAPRRLRLLATALLIALQLSIGLSGNYAFFNLLTIALSLLLIDDAAWGAIARTFHLTRQPPKQSATGSRAFLAPVQTSAAALVLLVTLPVNAGLIYSAFSPEASWPATVTALQDAMEPFHVVSGYGLFRVMTKTRPEIVIEGSNDGVDWTAYEFRWKPGDVNRAPRWVAPHQPRLDWQMWFAALGSYRNNRWFLQLCERLLQGSPSVLRLLERNPFPEAPPRYLRARLFDYNFTTPAEHRESGAWWKREERSVYLPKVSLHDK